MCKFEQVWEVLVGLRVLRVVVQREGKVPSIPVVRKGRIACDLSNGTSPINRQSDRET